MDRKRSKTDLRENAAIPSAGTSSSTNANTGSAGAGAFNPGGGGGGGGGTGGYPAAVVMNGHGGGSAAAAGAGGKRMDMEEDGPVVSFAGATIDKWLPRMFDKPCLYAFGRNLSAGITVSLVNVPLSIALSIASNCPPIYGVVTAIWAGLFAAVCGGSHFNIVGPTGALSSVLSTFAIRHGAPAIPTLALTTGVMCLVFFVLHWDIYVRFLPGFVIHGFTVGVAFTIAGGQIASACGLRGLQVFPDFRDSLWEAVSHLGDAQSHAIALFLCSWVPLYTLVRLVPRIPWSIPLCVLGIGVGYLSDNGMLGDAGFLTLRDKYGVNALSPTAFNVQSWAFGSVPTLELLQTGMSVTFVAVLETLISGRIAESQTRTTMNQRREVFGAAMANIAAGMAGGLPATAALARTALNIRSGAWNRLSGIVNAVSTTLLVLVILPAFTYLPLPVVAALLFQVAVGMIEVKHIREYWATDRTSFTMTLVVAVFCVAVDSSAGIVVGAIVGLLRFAKSVSKAHSEVILSSDSADPTEMERPPLVLSNESLHKALLDADHHEAATQSWYQRVAEVFRDPNTHPWTLASLKAMATTHPHGYKVSHHSTADRQHSSSRMPRVPSSVGATKYGKPDRGTTTTTTTAADGTTVSVRVESLGGNTTAQLPPHQPLPLPLTMPFARTFGLKFDTTDSASAGSSGTKPPAAAPTGEGADTVSALQSSVAGTIGTSAATATATGRVGSAGGAGGHCVPIYRMYGKITYVNLQEHHDLLQKLYGVAHREIILSLQHTFVFDIDGIDGLEEIDDMMAHAGRVLLLADVHLTRVLRDSHWYQTLLRGGRVFATADDALEYCRQLHRHDFDGTAVPLGPGGGSGGAEAIAAAAPSLKPRHSLVGVTAAAAADVDTSGNGVGHGHGGVASRTANADPAATDTSRLLSSGSGAGDSAGGAGYGSTQRS